MSAAVAIFVKTPGLSPIKTRLAAGIGAKAALEFYHLSVKAVEETVSVVDIKPFWAVAEKEGLDHPLWAEFETLHSGEGGLGERQHYVCETLRREYKNVILIGADAPQLSPEILEQAIAALDEHDFVIGPAHDGGYYLFGGCAPVEKDIWKQIPWSADNTRESFEALLPSTAFHLLPLTDMDTEDDLRSVADEMPETLSHRQKSVLEWIKNL